MFCYILVFYKPKIKIIGEWKIWAKMLINCGFINSKNLKGGTNAHTKHCHTHKIDI